MVVVYKWLFVETGDTGGDCSHTVIRIDGKMHIYTELLEFI